MRVGTVSRCKDHLFWGSGMDLALSSLVLLTLAAPNLI